jgi:acyl-CoA thioester hydrolase
MTADAAARPDQTFSRSIRAPWSDMDQNGHMRTTAYLAATEDVRMQFFDAAGVTL